MPKDFILYALFGGHYFAFSSPNHLQAIIEGISSLYACPILRPSFSLATPCVFLKFVRGKNMPCLSHFSDGI